MTVIKFSGLISNQTSNAGLQYCHRACNSRPHPLFNTHTGAHTLKRNIVNAHPHTFQLDYHEPSDGPTDGPIDGRTKPPIEPRVHV